MPFVTKSTIKYPSKCSQIIFNTNTFMSHKCTFTFVEYMDHHKQKLPRSNTHTNHNACCHNYNIDTCPHLSMSTCHNINFKGERIAWDDIITHYLTNTIKSCIYTQHCTLINASAYHNKSLNNTAVLWIFNCICDIAHITCMIRLWPIIKNDTWATTTHWSLITCIWTNYPKIELTFIHDRFNKKSYKNQIC